MAGGSGRAAPQMAGGRDCKRPRGNRDSGGTSTPEASSSRPRGGVRQLELGQFLVDRRTQPQVQPQDGEPSEEEENMSSDEDDDLFNPDEIESDPALRRQIDDYHPDVQDRVRRAYLLKGPTQPNLPHFERTNFGSKTRAFSKTWYKKYDWIEYSEDRNAAFCFYCFLFKQQGSNEHFGYDVFNKKGFKDWKHAYKALPSHVGGVGSAHNKARLHCDDFRNHSQSVSTKLARATEESKQLYKIRLHSSLGCARYLISQGLSFRGHDESSTSLNKGNFLEMIDWHKINDEKVRDAFDRAGRNCKTLSPEIQKDLSKCCAQEVTEVIMREIGDRKFSVLIDESRDISVKEQMAVMLRYVSSKGKVVERFLSLYHVKETTSMALKEALDAILDHYKSKLRNKIANEWFNDLMICYTEREIFKQLDDDLIVKRFQAMRFRRGQLPRPN